MAAEAAASARSWGAAGLELSRLEHHAEAAAALEQALHGLPLDAADGAEATLLRAEWTAACANARAELGASQDSVPDLRAELDRIVALPQ